MAGGAGGYHGQAGHGNGRNGNRESEWHPVDDVVFFEARESVFLSWGESGSQGRAAFFVGDLKELLTTNFSLIIGALIDMFVSVKLINRINESETLQRNF